MLNVPMMPKNDLGSIPLAVLKSVPVVLRDLIASRTPCTIATHDTKEKTEISFDVRKILSAKLMLDSLIILAPIASASDVVKDGVSPPEMTLTRTYSNGICISICQLR